jgi:hypothetical protein
MQHVVDEWQGGKIKGKGHIPACHFEKGADVLLQPLLLFPVLYSLEYGLNRPESNFRL